MKNDYCRLCWLQAASQADNLPAVTEVDLRRVTGHQLSFAGMSKMRGPRSAMRLPQHLGDPLRAKEVELVNSAC